MTDFVVAIEHRIEVRARELWEKGGGQTGSPDDYWKQALSEIESEEAGPCNDDPKIITALHPGEPTQRHR